MDEQENAGKPEAEIKVEDLPTELEDDEKEKVKGGAGWDVKNQGKG